MNNFYVYVYFRLDTNTPFYVGKGKGKRAFKIKENRNQYFKNIVKSIPYKVEFAFNYLTESEAFDKEIALIKLYKSFGYCEANLTDGGDGVSGLRHSEESKIKMSILKKGRKNPHKGYIHSLETKLKLSNSLKGIIFSEERKTKISAAKKGKHFSKKHKEKLSLAQKNKPRPWRSKSIECIETGIIYKTVQEASKHLGIAESTLTKQIRCKGRNRKTGLTFKYIENKKP